MTLRQKIEPSARLAVASRTASRALACRLAGAPPQDQDADGALPVGKVRS